MQKYFTINSTETQYDKVNLPCIFEEAILKKNDYPKILVSLPSPIPCFFYENLNEDLSSLILAPRLQGNTVYPEISKPCYVYMCIPKKGGTWLNGPWEVLDWGEIKLPS